MVVFFFFFVISIFNALPGDYVCNSMKEQRSYLLSGSVAEADLLLAVSGVVFGAF